MREGSEGTGTVREGSEETGTVREGSEAGIGNELAGLPSVPLLRSSAAQIGSPSALGTETIVTGCYILHHIPSSL